MKILVTMGTRPEIIKLGPVCRQLASRDGIELNVFWTGQHVELAAGLADLFQIRITHSGSEVMEQPGLGAKFGFMVRQIEDVLRADAYDWLVVQGDTTTAAAAAMAGFLNSVPVAHVEAGLRTGHLYSPWPEEFNRRVITLCTHTHFAPTASARDALVAEGIAPEDAVLVGNTVVDALLFVRECTGCDYQPIDPAITAIPADRKLVLATLHRRENIGDHMRDILNALRILAGDGDKVIVLPVHLNPDVRSAVHGMLADVPNVHLLAPLQYPDFVHLLGRAWTVVTDSGGVQEEAPAFGLQILITRDTTERPECVAAGFGTLVGSDVDAIVAGVRRFTSQDEPAYLRAENPFGDGSAARRIAERLLREVEPVLLAAE